MTALDRGSTSWTAWTRTESDPAPAIPPGRLVRLEGMTRILLGAQEGTAVAEPKGELADLYVRHVPAANRLAFLLTGDRSHAEDLVHDAFVRCVGRFGHLRAHEAFDAYLRRTIVNLHTSRLRRVRVEREFLSKEAGGGVPAATRQRCRTSTLGRTCGDDSERCHRVSERCWCSATTKTCRRGRRPMHCGARSPP